MTNAVYAVVMDGDAWRIAHDGKLYDRYPTEAAAVSVARDTAQTAAAAGFQTRVMVEQVGGSFRADWSSTAVA